MSIVNPDIITDIIKDCTAEYILPRYQKLESHEVYTKTGPNDLVTIADREMEYALIERLPDILPGSIVIGEEGVSEGIVSTDQLKDTDTDFWIVDPVDGTYNFRHGKRHFGVMVALVSGGQTVMGWTYDVLGEKMMITESGSGAYLADKRLEITPSNKPASELEGFAYYSVRSQIKKWQKRVKSINTLRCSAHEYLQLLQNQHDFGVFSHCRPWDHLVGTLAYREAGGIVKTFEGEDYMPAMDKAAIIVARDDNLWNEIRRNINK